MNEVWTASVAPVARYVFTSTRKLKTGTFVEKWLRWNSFGPHLIGDDIGLASSTQLTWQSYSPWIAPNPMQVFTGNVVDDVIQWNDGHWTLVNMQTRGVTQELRSYNPTLNLRTDQPPQYTWYQEGEQQFRNGDPIIFEQQGTDPVSYTHLTLPTKRIV